MKKNDVVVDVESNEIVAVDGTAQTEEKETFKMKAAKIWDSKPVKVIRTIGKIVIPAAAGFVAGVALSKASDANTENSDEDFNDFKESYDGYEDNSSTEA